ncbi:entericidin EcnA/B family protein [Cochlodiniinecator piscidefendens]|nr:entericidin EcnA/B family protein [Cochlodiniinecator piscidefendens]
MKKMFILAVAGLMTLSACATVEGLGRDISGGARRVSEVF